MDLLNAVWGVTLALAPWMLLGMAVAGLLHVALPRDFVHRQLRGRWAVLKAVSLGVPLPLCSCGVIPAGLGLKRDGASNGASVGFLISTPQTGVDSMLVSASFLGWPFALFKVVAALVTGAVGGLLTDAVSEEPDSSPDSSPDADSAERRGLRHAVDHALSILRSIWGWLLFGIVASAAIEVLVPDSVFTGLAGRGSLLPVLAALVISLPLYICATASVPIAAALVAGGMPPGAALVFLMAGPATNVATIGAIFRGLGMRSLAVYLGTIVVGSAAAGIFFDSVIGPAAGQTTHVHGETTWWAVASAAILLALIGWFAIDDVTGWVRRRLAALRAGGATIEVRVTGMTCGGCASKLERALRRENGVESAEVSAEAGRAVVRGSVAEYRIRQIVESTGFGVV